MPTFIKCESEVTDLLDVVLKKWHRELTAAGVTIDCLFAQAARDDNGQPKGPALKHNGYPAAAKIRVLSLKDRVAGRADAELLIDGDRWNEWTEKQQLALLDHECEHLEPYKDRKGRQKTDDAERPKLKLRVHDWELGGFQSIAARHGDVSFERKTAQQLVDNFGQVLFPWMDKEAARVVPMPAAARQA